MDNNTTTAVVAGGTALATYSFTGSELAAMGGAIFIIGMVIGIIGLLKFDDKKKIVPPTKVNGHYDARYEGDSAQP